MKRLTRALVTATTLAGTFAVAAPAQATVTVDGNGCRYAPVYADGTYVLPCITDTGHGGYGVGGTVTTHGTNHTQIWLCMQLLIVWSNGTSPSSDPKCVLQWADNGSVSADYGDVQFGDYVIHAWFTSPTYFDGGESKYASVGA